MSPYEYKRKSCPRCGRDLTCKNNLIELCDCLYVRIPAEVGQAIGERYSGCLCVSCLRELSHTYLKEGRLCDDLMVEHADEYNTRFPRYDALRRNAL